MPWWLLLGAAWASDPDPGLLAPGGAPVDRGWWSVGTVAGGLSFSGRALTAGGLVAQASPVRGMVVSAGFGGWRPIRRGASNSVAALGSVRQLVVQSPRFNLGLAAVAGTLHAPASGLAATWVGGAVVMEGGGRVRGDLTLVAATDLGNSGEPIVAWTALLSEAGVSIATGPGQRLRFGKYPWGIGADYRFQHESGLFVQGVVATWYGLPGVAFTVGCSPTVSAR